jgi:nitrilase
LAVSSEWLEIVAAASPDILANGGSCISSPDGQWLVAPSGPEEGLLVTTIDRRRVLKERRNFDLFGHHSRPDIRMLEVNRKRQKIVELSD